ncbi:MAG: pyrroloquinoline quinone-dependent dehydrogenase [Bacteroidota bacterium]
MKRTLGFAALLLVSACTPTTSPQQHDWPHYKADKASSSYSTLDQINRDNVSGLEVAWEFRTNDGGKGRIECSPIVVDGIIYLTTSALHLVALDAATGEELWRFEPSNHYGGFFANRGVTYWEDGEDKRIYYPAGTRLFAVNATDGTAITAFGENGSISMGDNLSRDIGDKTVSLTTPPVIFEDLLIAGSSVSDNNNTLPNPPGDIRAFNLHTGELAWTFHVIPHPGEFGYDTWPPDAWSTVGAANSWAGMALDEERGIVYAPTSSPAPEHSGGVRPGMNLFGNSILALDARTGERVWHFQVVHHDIWDYDVAAPPNLVTFEHDGVTYDAVAQTTKVGMLFVLDRDTGEPIFDIEERPVPQTTMPDEQTWPTQPFTTEIPPYTKHGFTEADITDINPEATAYVKETYFDKFGPAVIFQPPTTQGMFMMPQFNGGSDWGGAAFDPETGILYINSSEEPEAITMLPAPPDAKHDLPFEASGHDEIYDPEGFPVSKPPWGLLNAIDLTQGDFAWRATLGTYPELEARGFPPTGTFNFGGPIVTKGGLVFIGATRDERFRAFDKATGEVLWEFQLPYAGYATPATYMVDGKQYVVIAAAGGGIPGTESGDVYMAFALE